MTRKEFQDLSVGDVIRHKSQPAFAGQGYVVTATFGDRVTAVRTADVTNPDEWELAVKISERTIPGVQ